MPDGAAALRPAPALRLYPHRTRSAPSRLEDYTDAVFAAAATARAPWLAAGYRSAATTGNVMRAPLRDVSLETMRERVGVARLALGSETDPVETLATVAEMARRTVGLDAHHVQLMGALALLDGRLAEMATGEGKSLVAALAASVAALSGTRTHIVTVNDYLAARDAETFAPLFGALGIRVAAIDHSDDQDARRSAYGADVVYVSNKELAFDHLRDRVMTGGRLDDISLKLSALSGRDHAEAPVLRGLMFAIVDEADSVLIDEARTPLILSREGDGRVEAEEAAQALALAATLSEGVDYTLALDERRVTLTEAGRDKLAAADCSGPFANTLRREDAVRRALVANHLMRRGVEYVVQHGKIVIVDEYTGRLMPERSWSEGLHQLVEHKEGLTVTGRKETLARTSYQRFFARYLKLAGLTGTAREVRAEIARTYGLVSVTIPQNRPAQSTRMRSLVADKAADKWAAVVARAGALQAGGRPVLIGTRSVAASEAASAHLSAAGIDHAVLNAENDGDEADVIAAAGEAGRVTVATNMAGRGVHIGLGEGVAARGGLHVILTERHDARRIDRQLEGRAARQGEPGSTEAILSLDDPLLATARAPVLQWLARAPLGWMWRRLLVRVAQRRAERLHFAARRALLRQDRRTDTALAFGGRPD